VLCHVSLEVSDHAKATTLTPLEASGHRHVAVRVRVGTHASHVPLVHVEAKAFGKLVHCLVRA
jgi:hypothetical protein